MAAEFARSRRLAILYAYNGSKFQGLERTKGLKTVEGSLLTAIASIVGEADPNKKISLLNISRASATEADEHAARQVLSLEISGEDANGPIPTTEAIQNLLPDGIKVLDVVELNTSFSARRTCDTRTFEYLLPTYVFAPPPPETYYCYPPQTDDIDDPYPEDDTVQGPPGGLFKTIKRSMSMKRSKSRARSLNRNATRNRQPSDEALPPPPSDNPRRPTPGHMLPSPPQSPVLPEKKSGFRKLFETLTRGGRKKQQQQEDQTAATIARQQSRKGGYNDRPSNVQATFSSESVHYSTSPPDREEGFSLMSTLKRSVSRRSVRRDPELNSLHDTNEAEGDEGNGFAPEYFDPLNLPAPTEEEFSLVRQFRISEDQLKAFNHILAIFNGTHNWHNYIAGAKYEDPRCYMRILNIESSLPEVQFGMEWIRVKIQAKAFARFQIRKMIAMAVMVVRTNTPRSVVANSFGVAKIEIPEAPGMGLILDEPVYETFNSDCQRRDDYATINFDKFLPEITSFRHHELHDAIYRSELQQMRFGAWLRSLDSYSFLYTYFLNERGVVRPNNAYLSPQAVEEERRRKMEADGKVVDGLFAKEELLA
ncbi:pseudouridine synthase [Gaertneriomyces semiglobifer]|nr:pseudouridine synthase [Gaertneriomyces semiglobifer]